MLHDFRFHKEAAQGQKYLRSDQRLSQKEINKVIAKDDMQKSWYCDHHKYTLIFWSKTIQKSIQDEDERFQRENVHNFASKLVDGYS